MEIGKKRMLKSRVFYYASSNFQFQISNFFDKDSNCFGQHIFLFFMTEIN